MTTNRNTTLRRSLISIAAACVATLLIASCATNGIANTPNAPTAPSTPTATSVPATPTSTTAPTATARVATPTSAPTATTAAAPTSSVSSASFPSADNTWTDSVSPTAIPLGDGKVSTTPQVGYVDSCTSNFRAGGGAQVEGPWINTASNTWDEKTKISVAGEQYWSAASYSMSVQGNTRVITTNDLPVDLPTGVFPISPGSTAYQYDRNPNSIAAQTITYSIPANPTAASKPSCTGLGPIGVTTAGVLIFNALDDAGHDAGAHEIQDSCHGHPNGQDLYHYHTISSCLAPGEPNTSMLIGYALDGYGLYAEWNAQGNLPTNADLDACHGRTSSVMWDGKMVTMYHYDVTIEYPYTIGCYHGTPVQTHLRP